MLQASGIRVHGILKWWREHWVEVAIPRRKSPDWQRATHAHKPSQLQPQPCQSQIHGVPETATSKLLLWGT
jgi:hypothetical protein